MSVDFTKEDLMVIFGQFDKQLCKIEEIKEAKHQVIDKKNLKQDIKLYTSITSKILEEHPEFIILKESKF